MSKARREYPEPPCDHFDELVGTVTAGDFPDGPHCSVATCAACATKSAGYVQMRTGLPAGELLTYAEAVRLRLSGGA